MSDDWDDAMEESLLDLSAELGTPMLATSLNQFLFLCQRFMDTDLEEYIKLLDLQKESHAEDFPDEVFQRRLIEIVRNFDIAEKYQNGTNRVS